MFYVCNLIFCLHYASNSVVILSWKSAWFMRRRKTIGSSSFLDGVNLLCPWNNLHNYIDGLVQDCSNSSVLAMELLQSCTKP